jgi:tRNA threonylcarbamoyladenosine biosynthesis protein TsaB
MPPTPPRAETHQQPAQLLLAIDTCGPTGSVALARFKDGRLQILGQTELEGRSYSSTLVAAIAELLSQNQVQLNDLSAIVAVIGPGSFTGVRVGLSAVKGLAEPAQIPVVSVSRLEVLANMAQTSSAAIDAHRHEIFLRVVLPASQVLKFKELLAGTSEISSLAGLTPIPPRIAVCDEAAAQLLAAAWGSAELVLSPPPTAADALQLCAPRASAKQFIDLALLDAHYLRRSDAEIFGDPATPRRV